MKTYQLYAAKEGDMDDTIDGVAVELGEEVAHVLARVKVLTLTVVTGTLGPRYATVTLDIDGRHETTQQVGNGPFAAVFNAIKKLVPHEATLALFNVDAVTEGIDAQARVTVRLKEGKWSSKAVASHEDTLVAAGNAYASALCGLIALKDRHSAQGIMCA